MRRLLTASLLALVAPATGLDGHGYFAGAMDDWSPRVGRFLHRVGTAR